MKHARRLSCGGYKRFGYGSGALLTVVQQVSGAGCRTIQSWVESYETQGLAGLKPGWKGGNYRVLGVAQRTSVLEQLQHQSPSDVLSVAERLTDGKFWTVADVQTLVENHYKVHYGSVRSYHSLPHERGLSYQRPEGIYRSRPSEAIIADFEADAEKK